MEEQPLDVKGAIKAVKRYKALVALVMLAGLAAGVAYGVKTRPLPTARTLVLLPPNAITGAPGISPYTKTQEIIVTSSPVLSGASKAVYPPISPLKLKRDLTVTAPSQDVLSIFVRAASSGDAKRLADAVAASYLSYVDGVGSGTKELLSQLHQEADGLTKKILGLQRQIDATQSRLAREKGNSSAGQRDTSLLGSLGTEQEQLSIQLNSVNSQITSSEFSAAQSASATQLLQSAEPVAASITRLPSISLLGVLVGVIAGCVLAVGLTRGDRRLRRRDAIATAIGVPVVASMWVKRCRKMSDWRRLLEGATSISPMEAWNARRLFHRLLAAAGGSDVEVRLLVFLGDEVAVATGVKIARAASLLGMSSQLEVADQPVLAPLRAACVVTAKSTSGSSILVVREVGAVSTELSGFAATLRLCAVDREKPDVAPTTGATLLIVSSGFATSTELARTALAASDAGSPLAGVVIANPDPDDHTSGLLPEASEAFGHVAPSLNGHVAPELAGRDPR
jgi:capsular polysaccharide biosynthesis protein